MNWFTYFSFDPVSLRWLGDLVLQSSMILGGLWALSFCRELWSPAKHHLVLVGALCAMPLLMLASLGVPTWQWGLQQQSAAQEKWSVAVSHGEDVASVAGGSTAPVEEPGAEVKDTQTVAMHLSIEHLWLVGVIAGLGWFVASVWQVRRWENKVCEEVADDRVDAMIRAVAAEAGVHKAVQWLMAPKGSMPVTWGIWRPVIVLPADMEAWSEARLRLVIRHEMAHVARRDSLAVVLCWLAVSVLWFQPMMWLAWRRAALLRERACDDRVLNHSGQEACDYGRELVETVRELSRFSSGPNWLPVVTLAMASSGARVLRCRLASVLRESQDRGGFSWMGRGAAMVAVLAVVGLMSGLCACREMKSSVSEGSNAGVEQRVYFLTDTQWRQLTTGLPAASMEVPVDPYRLTSKAPGVAPEVTREEALRSLALFIRTRLLELGLKLSSQVEGEVVTLRDERTLLVQADAANHTRLAELLSEDAKETMVYVNFKVFTVPMDSPLMTGLGLMAPSTELGKLGILKTVEADALLKKLSESKGVTLMSAPSVTARSGQRAVIEVIREFIYPTEFDPPSVPQNMTGSDGILSMPVTPTTPTAFEMRPVGLRMEVESELIKNGGIRLALAPEVTYFDGFINYGSPIKTTGKDSTGEPIEMLLTENRVEQPIFRTLKCNTNVDLQDGDWLVMGGLATRQSVPNLDAQSFQSVRAELEDRSDAMLFFMIRATKVPGQ